MARKMGLALPYFKHSFYLTRVHSNVCFLGVFSPVLKKAPGHLQWPGVHQLSRGGRREGK